MTRTLTLASLLLFSLDHGHCQEIAQAAFDVASIMPCKPGTAAPPMEHAGMADFTYPGGRFDASCTTLTFLIEWAYGIQPSQHSNGPSWAGTDRYEIVAKSEDNASDGRMKLMVRTLLADRFRLKLHHESRELSVFVISVGKTPPRLVPAKDGETHSLRIAPHTGPGQNLVHRIIATRFSVTQLNDTFARQLGRPVVDRTGLDGDFDFMIDLTPDETQPNPLDASLLLGALREQLGFVVKAEKLAVDFLVIDGAEKIGPGN